MVSVFISWFDFGLEKEEWKLDGGSGVIEAQLPPIEDRSADSDAFA